MGCAQSKVDSEDSVSRCKERRNLMKEAVSVRNAFAAAYSGYTVALKEIGAALSDYAQGEVLSLDGVPVLEQTPPPPPPHVESSLPPPPPPLPTFSPVPPPLKRASTMPATLLHSENRKGSVNGDEIGESDLYVGVDEEEEEEEEEEKGELHRRKKGLEKGTMGTSEQTSPNPATPPEIRGLAWDYFFTDEMPQGTADEVRDEEEDYMEEQAQNANFTTPEKWGKYEEVNEDFKTPEAASTVVSTEKQFLHAISAPPMVSKLDMRDGSVVKRSSAGHELLRVLSLIDDQFLKASESAQEVSKMLEATKLHYHSNFADNRGHVDHAQRVMQVITWNKSFRGVPKSDPTIDNVEVEGSETHATVLDKLLAWEKKLYEEVKSAELIKLEYQRKVGALNKLKSRKNASPEQLEKAKAAVSHLHTRCIVDMQSIDSTISEVTGIRDKQLYPKLVSFVQGLTTMWESMCEHNDTQLKIVLELKIIDGAAIPIETTKEHHDRTKQLSAAVEQWHSQFEKLVKNQRHYISTLNNWLKLNLIPIESTLKEKLSSPPRNPTPLIQPLLRAWHDHVEKLPDEVAKSAIVSFAEVIKLIFIHQEEEMKLKERYESTKKEYIRKKQAFEDWYQKHMMKYTSPDKSNPDKDVNTGLKDPIIERQIALESLKKKLDEETENHSKHCLQVREKSLASLKIRLPELFRALSDYSHACFDSYKSLRLLVQLQHLNQ